MRITLGAAAMALAACGNETASPPATPAPAPALDVHWTSVAVAGPLQLELRDRLAESDGARRLVLRLTSHADAPLLVDLRSLDRVPRPDAPAQTHLPLTEAQIAELEQVSALTSLEGGASITYAVPWAEACTGRRDVALGGVLIALDRGRVLEMVADGAHAEIACEGPVDAPAGTVAVTGRAALAAPGRGLDTFSEGFPELLRAASISDAVDVSLLPFSYDARPVERWRYDACVALERCPARTLAQPPGSIGAPAVGMTRAGGEAFCATRSLHALAPADAETALPPPRALLDTTDGDVIVGELRCARAEPATQDGGAP